MGEVSVVDYPSIQAAIDANPGKMIYVPSGKYVIEKRIVLNKPDCGLFGPGTILQNNPKEPILEIEHAQNVVVRDLTLTRTDENKDCTNAGILAADCEDLCIDNVRVLDNRSQSAAITLRDSRHCRISHCLVRNYMRIAIDDRTASPHYGYAFHCIDGTGIAVFTCTGTILQSNRVIEKELLPTLEIKEKYRLGSFTQKNAQKGSIISQETWDGEYVNNWHQGSAIIVTSPKSSDCTQIVGNMIENAAQGIDIHSDHVIVSQNIVNNAFMGMKAMHGSRNVLIIGNQFIKNDLWSIGLMPGAASHAAGFEENGQINETANCDGGSIIANNIISDFGYGHAHWIWGDNGSPLKFDNGQLPHNPPLANVVVSNNVVYDLGREPGNSEGTPRYQYAVIIAGGTGEPQNLRFSNNIFPPGQSGICNAKIE